MTDAAPLTRETPISFQFELIDGTTIATIGDVEAYVTRLPNARRDRSHWGIAIRMIANAIKEPAYLKAATLSFQTALVLDGLVTELRG